MYSNIIIAIAFKQDRESWGCCCTLSTPLSFISYAQVSNQLDLKKQNNKEKFSLALQSLHMIQYNIFILPSPRFLCIAFHLNNLVRGSPLTVATCMGHHNQVAGRVYWNICTDYGLEVPWSEHRTPPKVFKND